MIAVIGPVEALILAVIFAAVVVWPIVHVTRQARARRAAQRCPRCGQPAAGQSPGCGC